MPLAILIERCAAENDGAFLSSDALCRAIPVRLMWRPFDRCAASQWNPQHAGVCYAL